MIEEHWVVEAEAGSGLLRVRRGAEIAWLSVPGEDGPVGEAVLEAEAEAWGCQLAAVDDAGGARTGLLVPRWSGGLLADVLRRRGGLPEGQALGVLEEALEAVLASPRPPGGHSRVSLYAFAVRNDGRIAVVPGRLRPEARTTDSAACGEILHAALTGREWADAGGPLSVTAPAADPRVRELTAALLESSASSPGLRGVLRRVRELGPDRARGFLPAEAGVEVDDAPTGVLAAEVVSRLREVPAESSAERRDRHPATRAARSCRSGRVGRLVRRQWRSAAGAACAVLLGTGAWLVVAGSSDTGRSAETAAPAPAHSATPPETPRENPLEAFAALTQRRSAAVAAGDAEALARLTVPGSPAAAADAAVELTPCPDCGEVKLEGLESVGDPASGEPDPDTAHVRAWMRTGDGRWADVEVELRRHEGRWKVHAVRG
ncbi:hypothetical protein [Brevibacterium salitolerans]|uniref:Uncharacterized protein n=1 Tax=Brevibacterium salitolerans TaxID=1403566 RepID=A0ABP5IUM1_9MICO